MKRIFWAIFILIFTGINAQNDLSLVVKKCKPSIFSITTFDNSGQPLSYGTGFFINSNGIGVSNYHVFEGAKSAEIKTMNGKEHEVITVISQSKEKDLITFKIQNDSTTRFPFLRISKTKGSEGQSILVIGNPQQLEYTVTNGIISSLRNVEEIGDVIQISAPISSGSSGSPLLDLNGNVLGIVSFTLINGQNLNFAISISNLDNLEPVNDLVFPPEEIKPIIVIENTFKRHEWKSSSSEVQSSETLKLIDKDNNSSDYEAEMAGIDLELSYSFEDDLLTDILFMPYRIVSDDPYHRKAIGIYVNYQTAYNEFRAMEIKLCKLLGTTYYENICSIPGLCYDADYTVSNGNSNEDINSKMKSFIETENAAKSPYHDQGTIIHRWINTGNNSYYDLQLSYVKGLQQEWDWSLHIHPINEK